MANKRAKVLSDKELAYLMDYVSEGKHPERDRAIILLSFKAGLRAAEIAGLSRSATTKASGGLGSEIFIGSHIAKKGKSRTVPMHPEVRSALEELYAAKEDSDFVAYSPYKRTDGMTANAMTVMLHRLYEKAKLEGCSSHSGRRSFITSTARKANLVGCSLRDVQMLAGHADLRTTQAYIELSEKAPDLVAML